MDTGAVSVPATNLQAMATTRIGFGARIRNTPDLIAANGELHYAAMSPRAWSAEEDQQAYGWVQRVLYSPPHNAIWHTPAVTWIFDDGPKSNYTVTKPLFDSKGF